MEDQDIDWSTYTPQEAREGMKRLTAKKGPRFDLLATPAKENLPAATSNQHAGKISTKRNKSNWIPPAKSSHEWRLPGEKEFDIDEEEME